MLVPNQNPRVDAGRWLVSSRCWWLNDAGVMLIPGLIPARYTLRVLSLAAWLQKVGKSDLMGGRSVYFSHIPTDF